MPIPTPKKNEKEGDFILRCMDDGVMKKEYSDMKQRAAVCHTQWDEKDKKKTEREPVDPERLENTEFLASQPIRSVDVERRTVDIIFFTGLDIPRRDFWTGDSYTLRFDMNGGDLSLLNDGAPVLDSHSQWGTASVKGVVERAWKDSKDYRATLRFSKREDVEPVWQDIQDKILRKFSMGVELMEVEKMLDDDKHEIRLAKKWRPFELSIVPIPADFGTTTLAAEQRGRNDDHQLGERPKENNMAAEKDVSSVAQPDDATQKARKIYEDQLRQATEEGVLRELTRVTQIHEVAKTLKLGNDFITQCIKDQLSIEKVRELAIQKKADQAIEFVDTAPGQVQGIRDEVETRRSLMGDALFLQMNATARKETKRDPENPFIGLTVKQIAEESVRLSRGIRGNRPLPIARVVELAMQTTSDFANVLENVARKQLLAMYQYAAPTYRIWTKASTTPDFKNMTRPRLGEAPEFLKVPEGGQITIGQMTDSKESYALATYGRGVSFSRQMLINDDLGAFNDLIGAFGVQAARLENKTVYSILNTNGNMADGAALFVAGHANLGTGVIGNTALDAMFTAMKTQKGIDGKSVLNLVPRYLIVPAAKEATARAALMAIGPNVKAADQNWFAGRLEPVADAELDGTSTVVWYGACDPAFAPGIEYAHLEGADGPQFIRQENQDGVLGIQFYAYLDFAAKAIDWRPLYKSSGA